MVTSVVDIQLPASAPRVSTAELQRELDVLYKAIHLLHASLVDSGAITGDIDSAITAHEAAVDPHTQYLTEVEADTAYEQLDTTILRDADINVTVHPYTPDLLDGGETALHAHKWPTVADTVDAGETVTIGVNRQLIVVGAITNNGTIYNDGLVYIL